MNESLLPNQGHGHVIPRADGALARCGGPAICKVCRREEEALRQRQREAAETAYLNEEWERLRRSG